MPAISSVRPCALQPGNFNDAHPPRPARPLPWRSAASGCLTNAGSSVLERDARRAQFGGGDAAELDDAGLRYAVGAGAAHCYPGPLTTTG